MKGNLIFLLNLINANKINTCILDGALHKQSIFTFDFIQEIF